MHNPPPSKDQQETLEQQREDYRRGFLRAIEKSTNGYNKSYWLDQSKLYAREEYPDPPQPREIVVAGWRFRCVDGRLLLWNHSAQRWDDSPPCGAFSTESIRALAGLLEHPHE